MISITKPGAGSDLASITTMATENGNEIVIDGVKTFISNGMLCDLVIVAAKDPAVQDPYKALSLYLVEADRPGFKKGKPLDKLGVRSQDTNELFFNECRIPKSNRLGERGTGFAKRMQKLQQERLLVAILAVSKAEFILEWIIDHFKKQWDSGLSPSGSQAVRFSLVAMANRVARWCLDLCGEFGGLEECPIVRTFRDLLVTPIFAGTNEIMKEIIAKSLNLL